MNYLNIDTVIKQKISKLEENQKEEVLNFIEFIVHKNSFDNRIENDSDDFMKLINEYNSFNEKDPDIELIYKLREVENEREILFD